MTKGEEYDILFCMRFNREGEPVKVFEIIKPIKGRVGYAATIFLAAIALGLPGCASNPEVDLAVKKVEAQKKLDDLMRQEKNKAELQVILDQIDALQKGQPMPPGKQPKSTLPETADPANLTCERVLIKLGRPTDGKNDCRELEKFTSQLEERSQIVSTVKPGKPGDRDNSKGGFPWGFIVGGGVLLGAGVFGWSHRQEIADFAQRPDKIRFIRVMARRRLRQVRAKLPF